MYKLDKQCIQPMEKASGKRPPVARNLKLWAIRLEVAPFLPTNFVPKYPPKKLKLSTHFDSVQKASTQQK